MNIVHRMLLLLLICACFLFGTQTTTFAAPPANFQRSLVVGSGLDGPSGFEIAPDGRIFILQRTGEVKIYKNGQVLSESFTVLPSVASGDRGLIGVTFDPDFMNNHYVYFYYTGLDLLNRLVRFDASSDTAKNGPVILYETKEQSFQLHVGGTIKFGPDGKLYLSIGDNGYPPNGQNLANPHGKILRLNKDGTIPGDNPFVGQSGKLPEIWAYGFRNPFRFTFDSKTGFMYEGDVGEATIEEINRVSKGSNHGWPICEGFCSPKDPRYIDPLYTWNHDGGSAASVAGFVYHGQIFPPEYQDRLFFGDYAKGFIKTMTLDSQGNNTGVYDFDLNAGSVVEMEIDPKDESMYYLTYIPGALYRVTYSTGNQVPTANATADKTKGDSAPFSVSFSSSGSSDPDNTPLSYLWDFGDGTTSTLPNPQKTYTSKGKYTVQLRVSDGVYSALAVPLVIQVGIPPSITIGMPQNNSNYNAGDTINYSVFATDGAGFDISDGSLKTEIVFHHQTHIHPFLGPLTGRTGSFTIPKTGESSYETWFEIIATATDTNGLTATTAINIYPNTAQLTFSSVVSGIRIFLDGIPTAIPQTITSVVGFVREVSAPVLQVVNNVVYEFEKWSDGGAVRHDVSTPAADSTLTAHFKQSLPFTGEYFTNMTLSGTPTLTRQDNLIDFTWDMGSPAQQIPTDNFSVRWTKNQTFSQGRYTFTTSTDDGVRLYIDNKIVIDQWRDQGTISYTADVDLTAGAHIIRMEYYEKSGGAVAKLNWEYSAVQPTPTITATPTPPATPTPTPTPQPEKVEAVYTDSLLPDWVDWSWNSVINLSNTTPSQGTKSISFTPNTAWAGFRLHRTTTLGPAGFESINFALHGTKLGQKFAVVLYDSTGTVIGTPRPLSLYGGDPIIGQWKIYSIPLSDFQIGTKSISDIILQEWGGTIATPVYVDTLSIKGSSTATPTPTPTQTPTPTPTATPTPPIPSTGFRGEYWNIPSGTTPITIPTTTPTVTRVDTDIDFTWNDTSPDPKITLDNFVVRWTKKQTFDSGEYTFSITSDDGARVYIDNELLINEWNDHGKTTYMASKTLTSGEHDIRVEYYEKTGGAIAIFKIAKQTLSDTYTGQYFANMTLSGTPVLTRQDKLINFVWNELSPDPLLPKDKFSVRWTKQKQFTAGTYEFIVKSDDGIRFWIDDKILIDDWTDHAMKTYTPRITLTEGLHTLKIEYYENDGGSVAIVEE